MRVCFVSRRYFPAISGMSVYAENLLRELVALGHEVTLISQYRGDAFGKRVYGGGPPPPVPGVHVIGREQLGEQNGGDFERDVDDLVATIVAEHERRRFEVIHAQYGYPCGWAALLASRQTGVPNVISIQGGDGHWVGSCCRTHELAMQRVIEHGGAVLIGGASFVDEVAARLGVARERFTLVPGAVDTARFYPNRNGTRHAAATEPVLLFHGRIDRRKGALDFVEACTGLAAQGRTFHALFTGIGPDSDAVRDAVALSPHREHFEIRGYVGYDDVPAVYREVDVFVSPTYAEGFSNTILEAMASGLPIVACRVVGVVDALRDDQNAVLVEPGDVAALTAALEALLADGARRRRLGAAALAECRTTYAWPRVAATIAEVYARVVAAGEPDLDWSPDLPREPCRFRETPHLL